MATNNEGTPARRLDDRHPAVALEWNDGTQPARAPIESPDRWTILLTSSNHGLVGAYGHTFPHASMDHVKVHVVAETVANELRARIAELECGPSNTNKAVLTDEQINYMATILHPEGRCTARSLRSLSRAIEAAVLGRASKTVVAEKVTCSACGGVGGVVMDGDCTDCNGKGFDWEPIDAAPASADSPSTETDTEWAARHLMPFSGRKVADSPSTAGAAKPVGSIGDYAQFHTLLGACYEACDELDKATGKEVFNAGDKLTDVQNGLIEYINTWSARLAAPALNPSEVRDQALEEAAHLFDSSPYAEEFRNNVAEQIRSLKSSPIKGADQQGEQGGKGGEA